MSQYAPSGPYDFAKLHAILARYPAPALFTLGPDNAYLRLLRQGADARCLLRATPVANGLQIESLTTIGDVDEADATARLAAILGIGHDLSAFYDFAKQNATLWAVVEPNYGLPVYRTESLYHALIFVIIEQHISWVAAQRAQRRLVEWAASGLIHDGVQHYAMPTPAQLAAASVDDLKPLKITFRRMELLILLSQQIVAGELPLDELSMLPASALYDALLKIKGIGHWTASVVVSRWLGRYDYVPHNDVALQAAVSKYFGVEKSATATQAQFEQYGAYAGLAAHFTLMRWVLDEYPTQQV